MISRNFQGVTSAVSQKSLKFLLWPCVLYFKFSFNLLIFFDVSFVFFYNFYHFQSCFLIIFCSLFL